MSQDLDSRLRHPQAPEHRGCHLLLLQLYFVQQSTGSGHGCWKKVPTGEGDASHAAFFPCPEASQTLFQARALRLGSPFTLLTTPHRSHRFTSSQNQLSCKKKKKSLVTTAPFNKQERQSYTRVIGFGARAGKT